LGVRFVAYLIDSVVPVVIGLLAAMLVVQTSMSPAVVGVVAFLLILAWALLVWWMFAVRAAGPGMRLMHLQLVGLANGRPIGWGRFFLRQLILFGLGLTGIGLLLMVIFLAQQPRRQGWHDLAVSSVVIKERQLAQTRPAQARHAATGREASPVPPRGAQVAPSAPTPLSPPPGYPVPPQPSPVQPSPVQPGPMQPGPVQPSPQPVSGRAPMQSSAPSPPQYGAAPRTYGGAQQATGPSPAPSPQPLQPPAGVSPSRTGPGSPAAPPPATSPDRPRPSAGSSDRPAGGAAGPVAAAGSGTWRAVLDDGREIAVDGLVLLGRNPQARPGEEHANLIKIADSTRTVSKSHLELGLNAAGLYVVDRGSTNGSTVTSVSGMSRRCAPGDPVQVEAGSIVSFGDHWLEVRRG
jgi:uncharacterized RDD family membrane protein YckC